MKIQKISFIIATIVFMVLTLPTIGAAQGRGRGRGQNRDWKCSIFANCHDARNGRLDGRGRNRTNGVWRNGVFVPRGRTIGYRQRGDLGDYWRRRHLTYGTRRYDDRWRRNRTWRNR
jgi:hypothetical protein